MAKLTRSEFWGGPFDGETVECAPVPSILTVYYDPATKRLDWTATALTAFDARFPVGFYWPSSPGRLTWRAEP